MKKVICNFPPMENMGNDFKPIKNLFVYRSSSPYNIYLLASIIRQANYEVTLMDYMSNNCDINNIIKELSEFDLVMISCNSWTWHPIKYVIDNLRNIRKDQIFLIGGVHATLFGRKILLHYPVDYIIRGEAERAVIPFLEMLKGTASPESVPGLVWKDHDKIIANNPAPLLSSEELGLLPDPLYDLLPEKTCNWLSVESSRGCVNHCIYCSVPYQKSWRPINSKAFIDKIERNIPFLKKTVAEKFMIIDDSFIIDIERAKDIAKEAQRRKLDFQAIWNGHVLELTEREMLISLKPFTDAILIGAESFDKETLIKIGKKFSPEDIWKGYKSVNELGFSEKLIFSFIIGFPWQTKKSILQQINQIYDLVANTDVSAIINWLILNPGSRLFNEYAQKKNLPFKEYSDLFWSWKDDVFPLTEDESEELNNYIKYLQSTIPNGVYRFQQHSKIYNKIN